ncbi:uncharacterized protein LOC120327698 [Styela clava]
MGPSKMISGSFSKFLGKPKTLIIRFSERYVTKSIQQTSASYKLAVFDTAELLPHESLIDEQNKRSSATIGDVIGTFKDLKNLGIKIAICSSSTRDDTKRTISYLGIEEMIDITKCAKDPSLLPKPHASNVDSICADTGVRPSNVVVVGNTPIDMKLGRNSKVGLTIGICPGGDCDLGADKTVDSITEVVPLLRRLGQVIEEKY